MNCNRIIDRLFLGDYRAAFPMNVYRNFGAVVSMIQLGHELPRGILHRTFALYDTEDANILVHLDDATAFIERQRKLKRPVLVHCYAGISRSATVVIAYLMRYRGLSFDAAYALVKLKRPCINPNSGFVTQLVRYEKMLIERRKQKDKPQKLGSSGPKFSQFPRLL